MKSSPRRPRKRRQLEKFGNEPKKVGAVLAGKVINELQKVGELEKAVSADPARSPRSWKSQKISPMIQKTVDAEPAKIVASQ